MACKQDSKAIGEHEYFVRQLPAKDALVLQVKLINMLGSGASEMAAGLKPDTDETEVMRAIIGALYQVTAGKNPDEFMRDIVDIVCLANCDGKRITAGGSNSDKTYSFNDLFNGHLTEIFEVLAFVIQVNFSDFIKGLLELGAKSSPAET